MQKATSDYDEIKSDPVELTELKKKTNERWLACSFIENSDQTRHGTMMKKLREQKALKHDQYPETLNDAVEAMNALNVIRSNSRSVLEIRNYRNLHEHVEGRADRNNKKECMQPRDNENDED